MVTQKIVPRSPFRLLLLLGIAIISVYSANSVLTDAFGVWGSRYTGDYWSFAMWGREVPFEGGKQALGLLGFGFFYVAVIVSVAVLAVLAGQKRYPLFSISEETEKKLLRSAFYTAIGLVALTLIIGNAFENAVRGVYYRFGPGYNAGLYGGGLCAVFLFLVRRAEPVRVEEEKYGFCPKCGATLKEGDKFCTSCGASIEPLQVGKRSRITSMGYEENIAGALCYILLWLTGIAFLIFEQENKFVRFHAWQSIATFLPLTVIQVILIPFSFIGLMISSLLIPILMLILWLILMFKAYQGKMYKLPIVGDFAEKRIK